MRLLLAFFIILISVTYASSQEAKIVEKLESGAYVVEIENVLYQALPPNKIREIITEREKLKQDIETYKNLSKQLWEGEKNLCEEKLRKAGSEKEFYRKSYESEHEIVNTLSGKLKKCSSKLLGVRFCWF